MRKDDDIFQRFFFWPLLSNVFNGMKSTNNLYYYLSCFIIWSLNFRYWRYVPFFKYDLKISLVHRNWSWGNLPDETLFYRYITLNPPGGILIFLQTKYFNSLILLHPVLMLHIFLSPTSIQFQIIYKTNVFQWNYGTKYNFIHLKDLKFLQRLAHFRAAW